MTSGRDIPFILTGVCVAGLLLGSCSPTVVNHGYRLDPSRVASIRPGVSSREEVLRTLGSPSATATFDAKRWYYISQREEHSSFYRQELVAQDVVAITFDPRGVVEEVEVRGLDQANQIDPSSDKTRTAGNELTLLQQIFGNIGRFNPTEGEAAPTGRGPGR